jgi:predicted secreted hydrolase
VAGSGAARPLGFRVSSVFRRPSRALLSWSLCRSCGSIEGSVALTSGGQTVGTLTAEGATRRVSGVSWLDRQWGPLPLTDPLMRWTWMNITLSNGDQLALWDILDNRAQDSWVTVQRPDGSYEIAAVTPLTDGASGFWTSPTTGNTYPTRWRIDIPALASRLSVVVSGPKGQEFPDGHVEATAAVTGSVKGRKVTGRTYIEMTGDWTLPAGRG